MVIAGAGGHAMEVLHIFSQRNELDGIFFYDNTIHEEKMLFDKFRVVYSDKELKCIFEQDKRFVLGLGIPSNRRMLATQLRNLGGVLTSIISPLSSIGHFEVGLQPGLNIMNNVTVYNRVSIGEGTLLNTACSIHHDAVIGRYCEICPGARILGGVTIGNDTFIGSGAIILPGVKIGVNCIIGAGAVVTKDLADNKKVVGVPAK